MMTQQDQATVLERITELLVENGFDWLAQAVNEVMRIERSHALGAAPYRRTEGRTGYADGYKPRTLHTRIGPLAVEAPQARGVEFYPSTLEKGVRSERALKLAVAEIYVQEVTTSKVTAITEKLCGLEATNAEVSRAARPLDEELKKWRTRPLGETPYLILDARYEHLRHGGQVVPYAVLVAIGIDPKGKRSILRASASLSEAEPHRLDFLASVQVRGLHGVKLEVADDHGGLREALKARLMRVPRQRCQFHRVKNALAFEPRPSMRREVVASLRAPGRGRAAVEIAVKRCSARVPKLAEWIEAYVPEGLAVFAPTPSNWRLRTINMLERLNKGLKRRARVSGLYPNEAFVLRLVSAVAIEISDEWETNRKYLTTDPE